MYSYLNRNLKNAYKGWIKQTTEKNIIKKHKKTYSFLSGDQSYVKVKYLGF